MTRLRLIVRSVFLKSNSIGNIIKINRVPGIDERTAGIVTRNGEEKIYG